MRIIGSQEYWIVHIYFWNSFIRIIWDMKYIFQFISKFSVYFPRHQCSLSTHYNLILIKIIKLIKSIWFVSVKIWSYKQKNLSRIECYKLPSPISLFSAYECLQRILNKLRIYIWNYSSVALTVFQWSFYSKNSRKKFHQT